MSNNTQTTPITGTSCMGGLEITYSIDTSTNTITTSLNFDGLDLGSGTMTPEQPKQAIWKNTGMQIFSGELTADYTDSKLECQFEISEFGKIIYQNRETVARW
ncbi:hypothetical protein ACOSP6_09635 [Tenacibaculum sp. MEBiC06402]|uniref:hypothetical protein n=1 Tax=unclassified Tenacibaculum TaxID=2635139 RepID=UPI003B99C9F3